MNVYVDMHTLHHNQQHSHVSATVFTLTVHSTKAEVENHQPTEYTRLGFDIRSGLMEHLIQEMILSCSLFLDISNNFPNLMVKSLRTEHLKLKVKEQLDK